MRQITLAPDGGTQIAAGIAQGVNAAFGNYMKVQAAQRDAEMKQAEIDLRRANIEMQRQKFQAEYAPMAVDFSKLGVVLDAFDRGVPVPDSVVKNAWQTTLDKVDDPTKVQMLENFGKFQSAKKSTGRDWPPGPVGVQDIPPGSASPAPAPDAGSTEPARPIPGMRPTNPAPDAASAAPGTVMMNRAERDILGKALSARTTANVATARNQTQLQIAQLNNDEKLKLQQMVNDGKVQLQDLISNGQQVIQNLRNAGALGVAQTNAGAKVKVEDMGIKAGKYNRAARGGTSPTDMVTKGIVGQITTVEKQIGDLAKPPGMSFETFAQKDQRAAQLKDQRDHLYDTYKAHTGKAWPGAVGGPTSPGGSGIRVQPPAGQPAGGASAAPAGPQSLKDAARAAKVGTVFPAPDPQTGIIKYWKKIDDQHIDQADGPAQ